MNNKKKSDIIKLIKKCELKDLHFKPEKFEKDNDIYSHIDFIYCFSNLRARNYNIEECNKEKVRKIAENIIPAIMSTTACIAGFVAIQIYSVIISNDITSMRNIGLGLGTSWYSIGIPEKVQIYQSIEELNNSSNLIDIPKTFSIWDIKVINGSLLAKELIDFFKNKYNFCIDSINSNNECILDLIENENTEEINQIIDELYFYFFKDK